MSEVQLYVYIFGGFMNSNNLEGPGCFDNIYVAGE